MKSYFRRIVAGLGELDVLTHTLPYQARIVGGHSARHC
jgi:hypothetical protein